VRTVILTLHPAFDRIVQIDRLLPGDTFEGRLALLVPSGKGVNTARGLGEWIAKKSDVVPIVWLGTTAREWYVQKLKEISGLDAIVCPRKCENRQALTILERGGRETHIKEAMEPVSAKEQTGFLALLKKQIRRGDTVVLCGSAPPKTPLHFLREVFSIARASGAERIIADTNGPALDVAGAANLDGLKGNSLEIGQWLKLPKPFDPENKKHRTALKAAFEKTGAPNSVLVTRGTKGACYADPSGLWLAPAPKVSAKEFRSATGCGDAATAGWLLGIYQSLSVEETLKRAVGCGSAKALSADPGELNAARAESMAQRIKVQAISY
jgi:fructose-1-phosphate kinase PfkB-like protein